MMSHRSNYYNSEMISRNQNSKFMRNSDNNSQQFYGGNSQNSASARNFNDGSSRPENTNDSSTMEERKVFFRQLGLPRHEVFEYAMRSFETPAFDLDYFEYRLHKMQGQHMNETEIQRRLLNEVFNMFQVPSNSQQSSRNIHRNISPVAPPPPNIQGYLEKCDPIDYGRGRVRSPPRAVNNGEMYFQGQSAPSSRDNNVDRYSTQNNWQASQQQLRSFGQSSSSNWSQSSQNESNLNSNNNMMQRNNNDFDQQRGSNFFDNSGNMSNFQLQRQNNNFTRRPDNMNNMINMNTMNNKNNINAMNNMSNRNNMNDFNNMNPRNNRSEMNNRNYGNEVNDFSNPNNRNGMCDFGNMNNRNNIDNCNMNNNMNDGHWDGFNNSNQMNHSEGPRGPRVDNFNSSFQNSVSHSRSFRDQQSRFEQSNINLNDSRIRNKILGNPRKRSRKPRKSSLNLTQTPPQKILPNSLPSSKNQPTKKASSVPLDPFKHQRSQALEHKKNENGSTQTTMKTGKRAPTSEGPAATSQTSPAKRVRQDSSSKVTPAEPNNTDSVKREDRQIFLDEFMRPEAFGDVGRPRPKGFMTREEFIKWFNENKWIEEKLIVVRDNDPALKDIFFTKRRKNGNYKKLLACEVQIEQSVKILDDWRLHNVAYEFLKNKAIVNEFLYVEKREYLGSSGQRCLNRICTTLRKANMIAFFKAIIQDFSKIYRKDFSQGYKPQLKEQLHDRAFNWLVGLAFKEIKLFAEPVRKLKSNKLTLKLKGLHAFATKKNKELYKSKNPFTTVTDKDKNAYVLNTIKKLEEILNEQPDLEYENCKTFMEHKLRLANKSIITELNEDVKKQRLDFLTKLKADAYVQNIEVYMVKKLLSIHTRLHYLEAVHPRMIAREDLHQMIVFQKFISEESLTLVAEHILDEWLEIYQNFSHPTINVNMQKPVHKVKYLEKNENEAEKDYEHNEDNNDDDVEWEADENVDEKSGENNQADHEKQKEGQDVIEILDD